jgi:hypothetical protein
MFRAEKFFIAFCALMLTIIIGLMASPLLLAQTAPPSPAVALPNTQSINNYAGQLSYPTGAVTVTLPGAAAKTTYLCGFEVDASATALSTPADTVTGGIDGTLNYFHNAPAVATIGVALAPHYFSPCVPANAVNTQMQVTAGAAGTGGNTALTAWGYQSAN